MTQKHKNNIRKGLQRKRRSVAMKESWARRKFDTEASQPNAANESLLYRRALPKLQRNKKTQVKVVAVHDDIIILKVS